MKEFYIQNIKQLITEKYTRVDGLAKDIQESLIQQLFWVQESAQFTPQALFLYQQDGNWQKHLHREIFRALSRIECMLLLKSVNDDNFKDSYAEFTADQIASDRISEASFKALSVQFNQLTSEQIDAHMRASIIASITLSPEARKVAGEKLGQDNYPVDSVLFSGRTITRIGGMYPIYATASEAVKTKLLACFPDDNRHWRHAFFLENAGCLEALRLEIKECLPTNLEFLKSQIQEWLNYWLINALGFNGHIKTLTGSEFMTESVYQRAMFLNQSILKIFANPELDMLAEYSQQCSDFLKLNIINMPVSTLVIRLLNMTNIFNSESAAQLVAYIKTNKLTAIIEKHDQVFSSHKVATYIPALLQNVFAKSNKDFGSLLSALSWVSCVIEQSSAEVTSFRLVTADHLIKANFENLAQVDTRGEVLMSEEKPVASPVFS